MAVDGGLTFTAVAMGASHTCGLTSAGAAYCWGLNYQGQLGTTTNNGTSNANPTPEAVSGGLSFTAVAMGASHTCGLTSAGVAYCWGYNYQGQLGTTTNNTSFNPNPTPQAVGGGLTLVSLVPGGYHTCGLTSAGVASCWGLNQYGQLGTTTNSGTESPNPSPLAVSGGLTFATP
jgi:alpha-tubulin suppressor-like RCC1 family protein